MNKTKYNRPPPAIAFCPRFTLAVRFGDLPRFRGANGQSKLDFAATLLRLFLKEAPMRKPILLGGLIVGFGMGFGL